MKQEKISRAYRALVNLSTHIFPFKVAYEIKMAMDKLKPIIECAYIEEEKLLKANGGTIKPNGTIEFETSTGMYEYRKAMKEMNDADIQVDIHPFAIDIVLMENLKITPSDIDALDGILSFITVDQ